MPRHSPPAQGNTRLRAAMLAQDWPLVVRLCRQALRKNGRDPQAHRVLGFALHKLGDDEAAFAAFRQAAAYWPQDAELKINHANTLMELSREQDAAPLLEDTVRLRPDHAITWLKLAQCCYPLGAHQRGLEAGQKALGLVRDNTMLRVAALNQCAIHRRELGQVREAVHDCEQAMALVADEPSSYTNALLFMLADPARSAQDFARVTETYQRVFEEPLRPRWPRFDQVDRHPWRRLRAGFISPDFHDHSVMYFVEGLLAQLDRRMFEVVGFYTHPGCDHVTQRVQCHVDQFVRLHTMTPEQQAQAIRAANIDIVIDLAGHTGHNALLALARKPAPVQVSWLGFPATTGLHAVDYKFTDEITDADGAEGEYTERLYRLPTLFCCYRPMIRGPLLRYQPRYLVQPTPALAKGYVTFGSCNNLGKLTDEVLSLWGRILQAVPQARLLIEGKNLGDEKAAAAYRDRCAALGIDPQRLELVGLNRNNQYLTYHRIDIALDPFPLTGGTTTFDLLWMGVPLVSMQGSNFKSRLSTGILTYLGRTEWLARDETEYLHIAQTLASDVEELNQLRQGLRREVEQSPLMREDLHTRLFAEGLRVMWLQWLAQQQHPENEVAQQQAMAQWVQEFPSEWSTPPVPGVGLEPGKRVPLPEAHALLQRLVNRAKAHDTPHGNTIEDRRWIIITELAEKVLCAVPHDPVALACLAEVEHAHGHTDFAVTYLRYATEAMATTGQWPAHGLSKPSGSPAKSRVLGVSAPDRAPAR
ncbi:MAG: tetratricopeptide repeat protein [Comamonas sp.]|nr:tetratricopeptide repeat protein [Comamonas sp.]